MGSSERFDRNRLGFVPGVLTESFDRKFFALGETLTGRSGIGFGSGVLTDLLEQVFFFAFGIYGHVALCLIA